MIESQRFGTDSLPIHPGRYRLVVSPLCPWCRMTTITWRLLGLQAAFPVSFATGSGPDGFEFISPDHSFDPVLRARTQREIYRRQPEWQPGDPTTVPLVVDSKLSGKIVVNQSNDILHDFCTVWEPFWEWGVADLYPVAERAEIDALDNWLLQEVFPLIGKIVHQTATEDTNTVWNKVANELNQRLANTPFLFGAEARLSDIRLFAQLCSLASKAPQLLAQYSHLQGYLDRLWETPNWVGPEEKAALDPNYQPDLETTTKASTSAAPACSA